MLARGALAPALNAQPSGGVTPGNLSCVAMPSLQVDIIASKGVPELFISGAAVRRTERLPGGQLWVDHAKTRGML